MTDERPETTDFERVLRALHDAGVEFILVGGLAAVVWAHRASRAISTSCIGARQRTCADWQTRSRRLRRTRATRRRTCRSSGTPQRSSMD